VLVPAEAADIGVSGITAPAVGQAGVPAAAAAAAGPSVEAAMAEVVKDAIAELLGDAAAGSIGAEDPLMQSGVNSTLAVQLTGQLETRLGVSLPATLVSGSAEPGSLGFSKLAVIQSPVAMGNAACMVRSAAVGLLCVLRSIRCLYIRTSISQRYNHLQLFSGDKIVRL
jgi:acyl carrier protein